RPRGPAHPAAYPYRRLIPSRTAGAAGKGLQPHLTKPRGNPVSLPTARRSKPAGAVKIRPIPTWDGSCSLHTQCVFNCGNNSLTGTGGASGGVHINRLGCNDGLRDACESRIGDARCFAVAQNVDSSDLAVLYYHFHRDVIH